jgi:hypothetical protein
MGSGRLGRWGASLKRNALVKKMTHGIAKKMQVQPPYTSLCIGDSPYGTDEV